MSDVLERFHRILVEEIRAKRPSYLEGPFTVAEIYQNLVPYGSHRDRLGVEMNGDYEDALLRLLAGEGDYLVLDSEHALRELREELESPHPNTGLYREFAAVDVRLNPDRLESGAPPVTMDELAPEASSATTTELVPDARGAGGEAERARDAAGASGGDSGPAAFWSGAGAADEQTGGDEAPLAAPRGEALGEDEAVEDSAAAGAAPDGGGGDEEPDADACRWCRASLPDHPHLNFCPFCGTDVRLIPCDRCGEEVEPGWRFCVSCGTEVEA